MKTKRFSLVVLLAFVSLALPLTAVFAFPGVPYDGQATATGIDVDLVVSGATVVITYVSQATDIAGNIDTPVATSGTGEGLDVVVVAGSLPGVAIDEVNVASMKIYDGDPTVISATDFVTSTTSPLATSGLMSTTAASQVTTAIGQSSSLGFVTDASVIGGVGGNGFVTADNITNTAVSETTLANALNDQAESLLSGVQITVPFGVGAINVLTADAITSTAAAVSDGTLANASATATINILNLMVRGNPVPVTPGTVITVTDGAPLPTDVARVTIVPTTTMTQTATSSSAEAIALLIEVLAGDLAGTQVILGRSYAESNVANNNPTGPTVLSLTSISSNTQLVGVWAVMLPLLVLGTVTVIVIRRRNLHHP